METHSYIIKSFRKLKQQGTENTQIYRPILVIRPTT